MSKQGINPLENIKNDLIGVWRGVYHASVSGTPKEQLEAEQWAQTVERKVTQQLKDIMLNLIGKVEAGQYGEEADFALSDIRQKVNEL